MLQAIGSISGIDIDAEYLRIIQELRALGLTPTGNKSVDAQRLAKAKAELIEKIHQKEENNNEDKLILEDKSLYDSSRNRLEEERLGAMNVAQLNMIYFHLY